MFVWQTKGSIASAQRAPAKPALNRCGYFYLTWDKMTATTAGQDGFYASSSFSLCAMRVSFLWHFRGGQPPLAPRRAHCGHAAFFRRVLARGAHVGDQQRRHVD